MKEKEQAGRLPWITWGAIERLTQIARNGEPARWRVLEWGAGGSTAYWADLGVAEVLTIEHDPAWAARIREVVSAKQVQLLLRPPAAEPNLVYASSFVAGSFEAYVMAAREMSEPDVVLVDGRARSACLVVAAEVAQRVVILDNSDRVHYALAMQRCETRLMQRGFRPGDTHTGTGPYSPDSRWSTTIWEKS